MTTYRRETREQWGAAEPRSRRYDVTPCGVAIHYPGPGQFVFADHKSCQSLMRRWQEMHMARGSNDLEYGAVLCHHLALMEARTEVDKPLVRVGSNGTATANTTHTSVQLMRGTLDTDPTGEEVQALGEYVAWLRDAGGWGPEVTGHRDHYATACPGDPLYARLGDIRRIADQTDLGDPDMPLSDEDIRRIADATATAVVRREVWVPEWTGISRDEKGKRKLADLIAAGAGYAKHARQQTSARTLTALVTPIAERAADRPLSDAEKAEIEAALESAIISVDISVGE